MWDSRREGEVVGGAGCTEGVGLLICRWGTVGEMILLKRGKSCIQETVSQASNFIVGSYKCLLLDIHTLQLF